MGSFYIHLESSLNHQEDNYISHRLFSAYFNTKKQVNFIAKLNYSPAFSNKFHYFSLEQLESIIKILKYRF